eukprot:TRINITY_DN2622_c0_g1_i1.p1 TRINITY_DN2622_c0_g1~~TRINITY_DN2622_c0_g1_i1.p1  ORF type:complete len:360 (-),score=19.01 TRINITY_DN2622_c0_g1_i1:125-1204(-)
MCIRDSYSTVKANLEEECVILKKAIDMKELEHIAMKKNELPSTVNDGNDLKELIGTLNNLMENFVKSKDIAAMGNLFQELCTRYDMLVRKQSFQVTSKYLYGLINPQSDCKVLCQYDIKAKRLKPTIEVKYDSTVTQINYRIFISGGDDPIVNTVNEFIENSQTLVSKMPMHYAKCEHTTQTILPNVFVAIGGCDGNDFVTHCEEYSISKNEWTLIPSLNEKRCNAATFLLKNRYLYAIGGYSSENTIEMLDITQKKAWTLVNLVSNELSINDSPAAFLISSREALILCGYGTNDVEIYDIKAGTIKKTIPISVEDSFYNQNICMMGSSMYIISYCGNVISYNNKSKSLETISYEDIKP